MGHKKVIASAQVSIVTIQDGVDTNLFDWITDWNSNKTQIGSSTVITPKIFAGLQNENRTITGVAIGKFSIFTKDEKGTVNNEVINGIYGFKDGYKTFAIDTDGNIKIGNDSQSIKYNSTTGKIEFGKGVSAHWVGATYINSDGIFAGTLSSNIVNTIKINASQITSGTIDVSRIDVNILKSLLITASNIEALNLNVVRGSIGAWRIDSDSLYTATKSNTPNSYTSDLGSITIGSNGIRGYKWRLDSSGSGSIAGNNISWDSSGIIKFSSAVSLNWMTPINDIIRTLGGSSYPKLTEITPTGIYTGTINASQITAGVIKADRIASGSIHSSKLDASSIKSNIINTSYLNGLSLIFDKGKIGGWEIGDNYIKSASVIGAVGGAPIQIRSASSGEGFWYKGEFKPYGISLLWFQDQNAGHISFGTIASWGNRVKSDYMGIQMMAWDGTEYFCLSTNIKKSGAKDVYNRIAGWAFDSKRIWKNNVNLGADGSITNGNYWQINNDGSGRLANGNISWNAAGSVTFSSSVSFNWTNAANSALNTAKSYSDNLINNLQVGGRNLIPLTNQGTSGWGCVAANGTHIFSEVKEKNARGVKLTTSVPSNSYHVIVHNLIRELIQNNETYTLSMDIYCEYDTVADFSIRKHNGLELLAAFGSVVINKNKWSKIRLTTKTLQNTNLTQVLYITNFNKVGSVTIVNLKLEIGSKATDWSPASEDINSHLTQITSNGIYTGTINATQITAGTIHSDRIATGSINSSKLDATSIRANIINTNYINGLSLTFTSGTIGGWSISANQISKNSVVFGADGTISNGTKWRLNTDGSGQLANGNFTWDSTGNISLTGTINATSGKIGGFEISSGRIGSAATGTGGGGGLAIYNELFRVGSTISYALFGHNTFPMTGIGSSATARITNIKRQTWDFNTNYGIYIDVANGKKNYGIWSNAAIVAPAYINNKIKNLYFTGNSYTIDFSQHNLFFIYANKNLNVELPNEESVKSMFGYSSLPSDFACIFTMIYNYNWSYRITLLKIRNNNGGLSDYSLERGDSITLICAKYPDFHYQLLANLK